MTSVFYRTLEEIHHPNWVAENASGLITGSTTFTDEGNGGGGGGNIGQTLTSTLHVPKFTFIQPAGDPAAEPEDSGDGQNQFTYSTDNPGKLTLTLKVKVEPAAAAMKIADHYVFKVGNVGSSWKEWGALNPGGKPEADFNGYLTATVTFMGLPQHNNDFGWKTAELWRGSTLVASNKYGVFFPKDESNHPTCTTCPGCPNWFYSRLI